MDFYEMLEQVITLLQRQGRVSYRPSKSNSIWMTTTWTSSRRNSSTRKPIADDRWQRSRLDW